MNQSVDLSQVGINGVIAQQLSPEQEEHVRADTLQLLKDKLTTLQAQLEIAAPEYKGLLFEIDKILRSYPEITYMLSEEDIGVIVQGLIKDSDAQFMLNPPSKGGGKEKKEGKVIKKLEFGGDDDI